MDTAPAGATECSRERGGGRDDPIDRLEVTGERAKGEVGSGEVGGGRIGEECVTNVNPALSRSNVKPSRLLNFIGGLGGKDISAADIEHLFLRLKSTDDGETVAFI